MKKLIIILLLLLAVPGCSKDPVDLQDHLTPEQKAELKKRRDYLNSLKKDNYDDFKAVAESREEAVRNLLEILRTGDLKDLDLHLITKEEYETMLWPYFPEEQTLSIGNTFNNYWAYQETRRDIGLTDLKRTLSGLKKDEYEVESVQWDPQVREYGPFKGHIVKGIQLKIKGETDLNRSIRFVVEYKGRFKVAGLSR